MPSSGPKAFPLEASWPALLRDLGVGPRAVLRRASLPEDLFSREGAGLSTPEYFRLWTAVEDEVGSQTFPLELAKVLRAEVFHPVIFAALASQNLDVAARRIAHYKRLVCPMRMHLLADEHCLSIELEWLDRTIEAPPSLAAFELIFFVQLTRMATREEVRPTRVETPSVPRPASPYREFFGIPVRRSEHHRVTFSRGDAERPFLTANEAMWRVFEPNLRQRLTDLEESASTAERLRAALLEGLPSASSSMEEIAPKLGVSKRTLQRRLRDEGTSFQEILNRTREALARHYLARTKLSGAEISYLLGFEDPNSFFRAFHSWTGETTEQARLAGAS